jgi:hypothetical protein
MTDEIRENLAGKRLIFTVTTGRSGTNYLANMLSYLPGVLSLHEPAPTFHAVLRSAVRDPEVAYRFLIENKLPAIAQCPGSIYIETSHVFCKAFFEPMLEIGIVPDLILLSRPKRDVAISFYQLGSIPARTPRGKIYFVQPDDPGVLPMPGWETMHDYQLNFWYTLEIERRAKLYGDEIRRRGGMVYAVTLDEISTVIGYWKLILAMQLPFPRPLNALKHLKSHSRRVNSKMDLKNSLRVEDWDSLEAEVLERTGYTPS